MQVNEFKRALTAFADDPAQVDVRQGRVVVQLQEELIDAELIVEPDTQELAIREDGSTMNARRWLLNRVARLPQLADRILSSTPKTEAFVTPSGHLADDLSTASPEVERSVDDVLKGLSEKLAAPIPASTSVLYLTSDAGEGKTTLISQLARRQAEAYKAKAAHWLLIPVPLGGKAFLRFDDVVIATLVNRFRFNYYFYDAFLELVRLGAVIPAFDGFEEMFVEGHSGEAVSALGGLIDALDSQGSIVVAARKAFFEYSSFRTQAKLFDSIGGRSASFSRLKIQRWGKPQFLKYAELRGLPDGEEIFELSARRLGNPDHPLLTRAVLVRRLFDVVSSVDEASALLAHVGPKTQDFFFNFVDAIVKREAREKWLDKSGDAKEPLLTAAEHHDLLTSLAREMWHTSTFALRVDVIDVLVDLFAESRQKSPGVARQLRERIRSHSLLAVDTARGNVLMFDHDDFRRFYLGEALGSAMASGSRADLYAIISVDQVPPETCDQAIQHLQRIQADFASAAKLLLDVARTEPSLSFAKGNCGSLLIRLSAGSAAEKSVGTIESVTLPVDALSVGRLHGVRFIKSYFQPTKIEQGFVTGAHFEQCEFERIEVREGDSLEGVTFTDCRFLGLVVQNGDRHYFGPLEIVNALTALGAKISVASATAGAKQETQPFDPEIELVERFLRIFLRTTHANEDVVRAKFGRAQAPWFIDNVLPRLIKAGLVEEISYVGRGVQRRFKIAKQMRAIQDALASCEGSFNRFLEAVSGYRSG